MNVVDLDRTRAIQWEASDPGASAWVVANAGSGKTHVLTQRVIRLLLSGADPAAILCLTFTKVAAAEMARRIFATLGDWTTLPDAALAGAIRDVQGRNASAAELKSARRLFARALETPGGLKIQTIHAFCERLLHQFPFEANVPGRFAVLDDTAAAALIAGARAAAMTQAAAQPQSRLGRSVRYLAEHAADMQIEAALDALIAAREPVRRWTAMSAADGESGTIDDALADLRRRLGLDAAETEAALCQAICSTPGWDRTACAELTEDLITALAGRENANDRGALDALQAMLAARGDTAEAECRIGFFLTEEKASGWKPRACSSRFSAALGRSRAGLAAAFAGEAERVLALAHRLMLAKTFSATEALLVVGDAILQAYHGAKRRSGHLDFGDLIVKTRNLLSRADAAAWVLYKLDARIEHILVDEAQDTSPDQWAVVQALAADFFSGATAAETVRTIFAVGDDKQSIFGFQGAAPHMLAEMRRFFARAARDADASFVERPLSLSFRSTTEVLHAVDTVFSDALADRVTAAGYALHSAKRRAEPGHVVVLPRIVRRKAEEPEDWMQPFDAPTAAELELAGHVADEIGRLIGGALPSGKRVTAGGILVLVRKRDAFVTAINRALRARRIALAGADRIPVASHIAVLDLLALADIMLLPEDDLQLAACLKGPLLGLDEDALMRLAMERRGSLWSALRNAEGDPFRGAAERLAGWRRMADQVTPFRFFATVLGPDGGRRGFRSRLGAEADDVLDAFLSQAMAYEGIEPPSLQGFSAFIRAGAGDIKREAEEAGAGVRVMTVHGAKGLEADVVFLVDTGGAIVVPAHRDVLVPIGEREAPAFLWRRLAKESTEPQRRADARADEETAKEYLRLLYVAMTRARDVLYVAGIKGERTPPDCWYSLVANALVPGDAERDGETGELVAAYRWPQPGRPPLECGAEAARPQSADRPALPDWLARPAPSPAAAPQPLRPSRALAEPDPLPGGAAASSFRPLAGPAARRRGTAIHRLLQFLPDLPEADRRAAAERYLAREMADRPDLAELIRAEVEAVLGHAALAEMFGPGSRAEVAIVGRVATERGDYAVSGQIDRLARTPDGWRVVDFKTGGDPPGSVEAADPAYILQLALYRHLLAARDPGVPVHASLVWTAGPNVMPIPAAMMERALARLGISGTPFP